MKKILLSVCMLCIAAMAMAQGDALKSKIVEDGGQGPYKAIMTEVPGLQAHTVFVPQDLSKFGKKNLLPVLVWGNGACTNSPWEHFKFLKAMDLSWLLQAISPWRKRLIVVRCLPHSNR